VYLNFIASLLGSRRKLSKPVTFRKLQEKRKQKSANVMIEKVWPQSTFLEVHHGQHHQMLMKNQSHGMKMPTVAIKQSWSLENNPGRRQLSSKTSRDKRRNE